MKKSLILPNGFSELSNSEATNISGGGFFGWLLGVVVGIGGVYADRTEAMRAADKEAGFSSHIQP